MSDTVNTEVINKRIEIGLLPTVKKDMKLFIQHTSWQEIYTGMIDGRPYESAGFRHTNDYWGNCENCGKWIEIDIGLIPVREEYSTWDDEYKEWTPRLFEGKICEPCLEAFYKRIEE